MLLTPTTTPLSKKPQKQSLHKLLTSLLMLLSLTLVLYGAEKSNSKKASEELPPHIAVMVDEIKNGSAILLDVREQHEWDAGHLELATLAPLSKLKKGYDPKVKDKNIKVYIHCRSGNRVRSAKPLLEETGIKKVIMLKERFTQLKALGLAETLKPEDKQTEDN